MTTLHPDRGTSGAQPTALPASAYCDPAFLERERAAIFAREWTFVADTAQLASPGDYVAADIAGYPAIIIAGTDGAVRGFENICRHRGGPLLDEGTGACKVLQCQYHGWTYGLDGTLLSARDFGDDGLETGALGLRAINVAIWRGLVFATLDLAAPPLDAWLGGIIDECAPFAMESFRATASGGHRSRHRIEANWKVYAENYQEGYHIPIVHPGLNRQIDARRYDVDVRDGYSVHSAPARDGAVTLGVWLWRFPALALNLYPNGMCIETYAPVGPASTRVDYAFYFTEGTPAEEREAAVASSLQILEEDRIICEAVQRNMASGLYRGGVLSPRHERGVADVQQRVLRALAPNER